MEHVTAVTAWNVSPSGKHGITRQSVLTRGRPQEVRRWNAWVRSRELVTDGSGWWRMGLSSSGFRDNPISSDDGPLPAPWVSAGSVATVGGEPGEGVGQGRELVAHIPRQLGR